MSDLAPKPGQDPQPRRSQLVLLGGTLMAVALMLPRALTIAAEGMAAGPLRDIAYIASDVFRAGFFVGIACIAIGVVRNRRWAREAKAERPER